MTSAEYQQLVDFLGPQFNRIDRRFETIDGHLGELRRDVLGHFDELYRRLERLEQEYQAITQALRRIESALADELGRREILERDLAALKLQLTALQSRIEVIEQQLGR